eukprot:gene3234-6399_t
MLHEKFPEVLFLDVSTATNLRCDSHGDFAIDGLHYCIPGPIDTWAVFLQHALHVIVSEHKELQLQS